MLNKRSLTLIEFLIIFCMLLVLIGVFTAYFKLTLRVAKEVALRNELANIRMSIEHYRIINGALPKELADLMNKEVDFLDSRGIILRKKFLEPFRLDKEGNLLDPFMDRYNYKNQNGMVNSNTKGYEGW